MDLDQLEEQIQSTVDASKLEIKTCIERAIAEERMYTEKLYQKSFDNLEDYLKTVKEYRESIELKFDASRTEIMNAMSAIDSHLEAHDKSLRDLHTDHVVSKQMDALIKELRQNWNDFLSGLERDTRHLKVNGGK